MKFLFYLHALNSRFRQQYIRQRYIKPIQIRPSYTNIHRLFFIYFHLYRISSPKITSIHFTYFKQTSPEPFAYNQNPNDTKHTITN